MVRGGLDGERILGDCGLGFLVDEVGDLGGGFLEDLGEVGFFFGGEAGEDEGGVA